MKDEGAVAEGKGGLIPATEAKPSHRNSLSGQWCQNGQPVAAVVQVGFYMSRELFGRSDHLTCRGCETQPPITDTSRESVSHG